MKSKFLVVHIITDLSTGGAQMMLYKLLSRINCSSFTPVVISLIDCGTLGDRIQALGIPVYSVGMKPGKPTPASVWRFIQKMGQLQPDLIQGWMYHGNLAAQLAQVFVHQQVPVLWSIRQSLYSLKYEKTGTAAVIRLGAKLSHLPKKIIYNCVTSANHHEKIGYSPAKRVFIPNGFEPQSFMPSIDAVNSVRAELGIAQNTILIGLIGRFHPMKDHANFLQAAAQLSNNVQFVLAGTDVDRNNSALVSLAKELGIFERIHLLGERHDISRITAALDIATSSSYAEAFANVIGEAMCCGVPCVVTDVGDSALIVGDTGKVVPARNPQALAKAWQELIDLGAKSREDLGKAARARIIEHFSIESVAAQYESLYESVLLAK